jgi:hypothetical protein
MFHYERLQNDLAQKLPMGNATKRPTQVNAEAESNRAGSYLNTAPSRSIVGRNSGKLVAIIEESSIATGSRLASPMTRKLIAIR